MAAKRPKRRRFLILRCRLFLASTRSRVEELDCSPANRERELGLDRRETGWFYPTAAVCETPQAMVLVSYSLMDEFVDSSKRQYERNPLTATLVHAIV